MTPGVGASVLIRNPSSGDKLNDLYSLIVDSANPGQLYGVGFGSGGTGGDPLDAWVGKLDSTDLDIISAKSYNDSGQGFKWFDVTQDNLNLYMVGLDFSGSDLLAVGKYLKSDLSKTSTVKWVSADSDSTWYGCGIAESGNYIYVAARTSEGATTIASYIAELNKSDLSINADYYSQQAAGGLPDSEYFQVECDGTNVFACGYETGKKAIVDKFDVGGLGNPTGTVITYGTSVTLYGLTYDETHLYVAGYDDLTNDVGIVIKLLKSDLSVVSAASYTDDDGSCRFNDIISEGDFLYAVGASYNGTRDAGVLVKINKSDLSINTQLMHSESTTPSEIISVTQDGGNIYTSNSRRGQSGSPATGHRSVIKWNKAMLTTGTSGAHTVATAGLTKATITPTIASTTRVLTASADSHAAVNYTEATSGCLMNSLVTVGKSALSEYTNANRILRVVQTETPYGDEAEIILNNSDQVLSDDDWRGVLVTLGFGFGAEVSYAPDLYVAFQEDLSIRGMLLTRLVCIGNWGKLEMHKVMGDSIDGALTTGTDTIQEIIEKRILSNMGLVINTSDGTEASKVPQAVYPVYTDRRTIIQECNGLTTNLLFMRGSDMHMIKKDNDQQHRITGSISGTFVKGETVTQATSGATGKFVYQTSTYIVVEAQTGTFSSTYTCTGGVSAATVTSPSAYDAFDYLYGPLAGDHTFYSLKRTQSILTANRVIAVDVLPDTSGTLHTYPSSATYYAEDAGDQATFGITTLIFEDASIASDADSLAAAEARLLHIQQESVGGIMIAPMNCGTEMYDYVQIDDDRAGWTSASELTLRVSKIVRRYEPGMYTIELGFGGLDWDIPANFDMKNLIDVATEGITRGPEGVMPREPKKEPPPTIPAYDGDDLPQHHLPPQVPPPPEPKGFGNVGTREMDRRSTFIGPFGGGVSTEQHDLSRAGVAKRLYREKQESDRKKVLAKELANKVWANITKGLKF